MEQATIVVVDDTDCVREVVESMLDRKGHTMYSFADPADALIASKNIRVDLFLIDVLMPKMSGLELLERLNVQENTFEAIMITGKKDKAEAAEAMRLGAYGILHKPFSYSELLAFVDNALASAAAKKQQAAKLLDQSGASSVTAAHL